MKKVKRVIAGIISATIIGTLSATVNPVYADDMAVNETEVPILSCKSMTFDEAIHEISGNYVWICGGKDSVYPKNTDCEPLLTIDENNNIHIIRVEKVNTTIKVKEGNNLPYDDIKDTFEAEKKILPVFRKNGNEYEIISSTSKENYNYALELVKACPEVLSVETYYKLSEDTTNLVSLGIANYSGKLTAEDFLTKYPDFTQIGDSTDGNLFLSYDSEADDLYNTLKDIQNDGDIIEFDYTMTEKSSLNPVNYYCNDPVIIDGIIGDANIDGDVDLSDAVMIMQSLANPNRYGIRADKGITAQGQINGDADGNGLTNNDALNIQRRLLGLGDIPIPQNDNDTTINKDDSIVIVNYDNVRFTEEDKNHSLKIGDKEYINFGPTLNMSLIGAELGEYELKDRESGNDIGKVYEINDVSPDYAIAVQYTGSRNYHVYHNMWYNPENVGQLIDGLNLTDYLSFNIIYYTESKPARINKEYKPDRELIWNTLFSDKDIVTVKSSIDYIPNPKDSDKYSQLEIGCDMPVFGRYNFGITVYNNGYVTTNAIDSGTAFFIEKEKALELIEKYSNSL